ncbi:MAG: hypothetical protein AAGE59_21370 [Cyanobacteria bacterium P01_F01_bin.86]
MSGKPADTHKQRAIILARITVATEFAASQPASAAQFIAALVPQLQNEVYYSDLAIAKAAYDLVATLAAAGQSPAALTLTEIPFAPETQAAMLVAVAVNL